MSTLKHFGTPQRRPAKVFKDTGAVLLCWVLRKMSNIFDMCCPSLHHASDFYLEEKTQMTRGCENRAGGWAKERDLFKSLFRLSASLHCWQKGQSKVVPRCRAGHSGGFSTLDSSLVSLYFFFSLPHYVLFLLVPLIILQPAVHTCVYHAILKSYFSCMAQRIESFHGFIWSTMSLDQFCWILFGQVREVTRFRRGLARLALKQYGNFGLLGKVKNVILQSILWHRLQAKGLLRNLLYGSEEASLVVSS